MREELAKEIEKVFYEDDSLVTPERWECLADFILKREIELLEGMKMPNYSSVKASFEYKLVDNFNQKLDAMIEERKK